MGGVWFSKRQVARLRRRGKRRGKRWGTDGGERWVVSLEHQALIQIEIVEIDEAIQWRFRVWVTVRRGGAWAGGATENRRLRGKKVGI